MRSFAQILSPVILFFILLLIYTKFAGPIPFTVNSTITLKTDTFSVTGEGTVSVIPDIANVSAGITANGSTVKIVQAQINQTINKVSQVIKNLGIDQKDIKTSGYNINPIYDYQSDTQRITGYSASTNLSIKVRDIDKVNVVIDAATANGANTINGIFFEVDNKEQAENEAREKAVAEAKKKAEQASRIAGFRLGKIINYSEGFGGGIIPTRALTQVTGGSPEETNIEPGSNEIKVTVTLSFEIF